MTDGSPKKEGLNRKIICGRRQPTVFDFTNFAMSVTLDVFFGQIPKLQELLTAFKHYILLIPGM